MPVAVSRVLLVSPDGMLGRAWSEHLAAKGIECVGVRYPEFDVTDAARRSAVDFTKFDAVVNCSGYTDVDGAEADEAAATAVNGDGVGGLASQCREAGATLVHYSTDYVFDGTARTPYPIDHPRAPVNAYGRSKAAGEMQIEAVGGTHLIIRTSWLYAPWGGNFVKTMARLAAERDTLRVVDDQHGRPTSAEHLAAVSLQLLQHGASGPMHVTDGGQCSWYELAAAVAAAVNPACTVEPCTSAEFVRPATRPPYSVLDLTATEAIVGPMPPWQDNVADVLPRIET
ncbi:MAG: dTDP-4-dehydrorhamnose reductase [Myxococcota bacterium]